MPGTKQDHTSECIQPMTVDNHNNIIIAETTMQHSLLSKTTVITPTVTEEPQTNSIKDVKNQPILETGTPLFYGLVAAGSTLILILLLCLIGVSVFACWRGCK